MPYALAVKSQPPGQAAQEQRRNRQQRHIPIGHEERGVGKEFRIDQRDDQVIADRQQNAQEQEAEQLLCHVENSVLKAATAARGPSSNSQTPEATARKSAPAS